VGLEPLEEVLGYKGAGEERGIFGVWFEICKFVLVGLQKVKSHVLQDGPHGRNLSQLL